MTGPIETRAATAADAAGLRDAFGDREAFRRLFRGDDSALLLVAERDGAPLGVVVVERRGHPVAPEWAWVSEEQIASSEKSRVLAQLLEGAITGLEQMSPRPKALAVSVAVGDRDAARRLESAGFRPEGGAYRVLGPGLVEHLHGYTDPVGFQVDFVRELGSPA